MNNSQNNPGRIVSSIGRRFLAIAWCAHLIGAATAHAGVERAVQVTATKIDGTSLAGSWVASPDADSIQLQTGDGVLRVTIDSIARIAFQSTATEPTGQQAVYLSGGGLLRTTLIGSTDEAIVVASPWGASTTLSLDVLAAVQWAPTIEPGRAQQLFEAALKHRRPAEDVLITRGRNDAKILRGRLVSLGPDGGSFDFSGRTRAFRLDKTYGVVLAIGPGGEAFHTMLVTLTDGSSFSGRLKSVGDTALTFICPFHTDLMIPTSSIASLETRSDRIVYVSDLAIVDRKFEGILHRDWPVRLDQSVVTSEISIASRRFTKGIGCHSRTELTYQIDRQYESLAATIGIDDAVRPAGSVVFRILGDGETLFDSGVVTGRDQPKDILVDVRDVKEMTLVVDFGEGLDWADHADWGGVRLIKPTGGPSRPAKRKSLILGDG